MAELGWNVQCGIDVSRFGGQDADNQAIGIPIVVDHRGAPNVVNGKAAPGLPRAFCASSGECGAWGQVSARTS